MDPLFFKLVRVVNLTARPFQARVGRTHQLTLNEWRVLAVLAQFGGLNATQVSDATGMDKMSVSRAVAGLRARKRLQRRDDPTDLRSARLYLTAEGKALYATVSDTGQARETELFAGLSEAELVQLNQTLDKLIASIALSETQAANDHLPPPP